MKTFERIEDMEYPIDLVNTSEEEEIIEEVKKPTRKKNIVEKALWL